MAGPVLDGSTPTATTIGANVSSQATGSFTPPNESLVVVFYGLQAVDSASLQSVSSMSNTGTALTWNSKIVTNHSGSSPGGSCEVWWAWNAASQAITVTGNFTRATGTPSVNGGIMAPKVFTNAASSLASAASAGAVGTAAALPTVSLTTVAANSWVWAVFLNWDNSTVGTAGTAQTVVESVTDSTAGDAEWTQKQNAVTASPSSVTMNDTAPSVRSVVSAVEILAALAKSTRQPSRAAVHRSSSW